MSLEIICDSYSLVGPDEDGGYIIKLSTSEIEQNRVAQLLHFPRGPKLRVIIEMYDEKPVDLKGKYNFEVDPDGEEI
jgi:hypothetical protein